MRAFKCPTRNRKNILALGPESAGNFSVFCNGKMYFSEDFGDLLNENNFKKFQKSVSAHLKKTKLNPNIIITDLHPLYKTTILGEGLSKKYKANHIQVQHHIAHVFSAIGEDLMLNTSNKIPGTVIGIACDGTGYGLGDEIWGGEIFKLQDKKLKINNIKRIGSLENQTMIGGDLATKEPARMLISILDKFLEKKEVYEHVKKFYTKNQFELLYNQFQQKFNCQETSSTGRVLDAASVLLGFAKNNRKYKHEPIDLLEKNSEKPYKITPVFSHNKKDKREILLAAPLFDYLIKNINEDKKRLAATAQLYIVDGLYEIVKKSEPKSKNIYFAGGMANNKIISKYLEDRGAITNKKIPRGDAGLSFGQIIYYLLANSRD